MAYNYSKLLGRMKECGYTQDSLAKAIGRDKGTINLKLNNKGEFKAGEMDAICKVLDISCDELGDYFFAK